VEAAVRGRVDVGVRVRSEGRATKALTRHAGRVQVEARRSGMARRRRVGVGVRRRRRVEE